MTISAAERETGITPIIDARQRKSGGIKGIKGTFYFSEKPECPLCFLRTIFYHK
jgi:hypothetical protein